MNWSMHDVLALARLSNAAYAEDSRPGTEAATQDMTWVGQVGNVHCQATIAHWGGLSIVCFRGTQVAQHISLPELLDDVDLCGVELERGVRASHGFWAPLVELWPQVVSLMPTGLPVLTGHSLGGVRAQLAKALCPSAEVVSFGAPRGADDPFWWLHFKGNFPLRVVHENDFAPDWAPGLHGCWSQPGPMLWLRSGSAETAYSRPGVETSILNRSAIEAHSIDRSYLPALEKLAS